MDADIGKEWIAALRSGEFSQTTGALRTPSGYCCLGVLCELYRRKNSTIGGWSASENITNVFTYYVSGGAPVSRVLPSAVRRWANLSSSTGDFDFKSETLANLNDHGATFLEIAGAIEANLEKL